MKKLCVILAISTIGLAAQTPSSAPVEWRYWGGDAAQSKYSTAGDITPDNVQRLQLAWKWETVDKAIPEHDVRPGPDVQIAPARLGCGAGRRPPVAVRVLRRPESPQARAQRHVRMADREVAHRVFERGVPPGHVRHIARLAGVNAVGAVPRRVGDREPRS